MYLAVTYFLILQYEKYYWHIYRYSCLEIKQMLKCFAFSYSVVGLSIQYKELKWHHIKKKPVSFEKLLEGCAHHIE